MAFFDSLINRIFPEKGPASSFGVMEQLVRSNSFQEKYQHWKSGNDCLKLIESIEKSFHPDNQQREGNPEVHLFQSPAANGFAIVNNPTISSLEFQYLLDYWRDKTIALNYRLVNSDRQFREKQNDVLITERHYLKPPISRGNGPTDQRFGNILLEYVIRNQEPDYLKLMVTTYSDHLFTKAEPYNKLVDHLFSRGQDPT